MLNVFVYCANVLDWLFVVLNVFLNFVLLFDGEIKLYIDL